MLRSLPGDTKRAVRIITNSNYIAHTEPTCIFKSLKIIKVEDLYKYQQPIFYYKLVNNRLPSYFRQMPLISTSQIHKYNAKVPTISIKRELDVNLPQIH